MSLAYELHEPPPPTSRPPSQRRRSSLSSPSSHPILFLHGLFGSKRNNRGVCKALARDLGRRVYALDLRNHGESAHAQPHDYGAMAEDVELFTHAHELADATLIGHSMFVALLLPSPEPTSGAEPMTLALRRPGLVRALVAVDNAPMDAALPNDFGRYIVGMRTVEAGRVTTRRAADALLSEFEEALPIRQFLLTNLVAAPSSTTTTTSLPPPFRFRIPLDILAKALPHMADFPDQQTDPPPRYTGPTLFVRGTRSSYVPDDALPVIGRFFPRFELRELQAGHWLIAEQPVEFVRVVVEFLRAAEEEDE
ncbi:MAG: hypothetical protein M1826_007248 [Phylliscum demangeonii]|nr:MAG: hypothetical protein M1826_007248 [Phylliscum demangeonii]